MQVAKVRRAVGAFRTRANLVELPDHQCKEHQDDYYYSQQLDDGERHRAATNYP
jgi:hypothetical protein